MTESEARALLPDLSSGDVQKRLDAALRFGFPGWTFALPELLRLAKYDPDSRVRSAAINALGMIGDRAAYALLDTIWKDAAETQDIREEALKACDRLDGVLVEGDEDIDSGGSSVRKRDPLGL